MKQPKAIPDHYPVIALAGNPNVGKSTLFNSLTTGKKQHTGNWIGKTTANAWGICHSPARDYTLVDIPGTYSLSSRSAEEEVARDFICRLRCNMSGTQFKPGPSDPGSYGPYIGMCQSFR